MTEGAAGTKNVSYFKLVVISIQNRIEHFVVKGAKIWSLANLTGKEIPLKLACRQG